MPRLVAEAWSKAVTASHDTEPNVKTAKLASDQALFTFDSCSARSGDLRPQALYAAAQKDVHVDVIIRDP